MATLAGEEMASAQILCADEVAEAIMTEPEDNFLDELACVALGGGKVNLEAIFACENRYYNLRQLNGFPGHPCR